VSVEDSTAHGVQSEDRIKQENDEWFLSTVLQHRLNRTPVLWFEEVGFGELEHVRVSMASHGSVGHQIQGFSDVELAVGGVRLNGSNFTTHPTVLVRQRDQDQRCWGYKYPRPWTRDDESAAMASS
jgi:hypothetical protein